MTRFTKLKVIITMCFPVFLMLNILSRAHPQFIEEYYSNSFNKYIIEFLNFITGIFPFSVGELVVFIMIILSLYLLTRLVLSIKHKKILQELLSITSFFSIIYISFMLLWGFNYNRLPFYKIAGFKMEKSSKQELYELCNNLIVRANYLREGVKENANGVMEVQGSYEDIFKRAEKGYEKASVVYPQLKGRYSFPKPIIVSKVMSYTGITGVYMPFTGEANVNTNQPDFELLFTSAHEMAHQRGFAREEEANYIAYLTCTLNPDIDYQYSGIVIALINSMNALARIDLNLYNELASRYSQGLKSDLKFSRHFWSKYSGIIEKVSNEVNDKYLKSNGQEAGVYSYGMMVDLLIAEQNHIKLKNKKGSN